jgi:acyl-CoA synthetase (AMP-forming)/AMP-acid ligase II
MAGFASKRTGGWNLIDWVVAIFLFVLIAGLVIAAINTFSPNSGLALALHNAGLAVSRFLLIIASFFSFIASLFAQL